MIGGSNGETNFQQNLSLTERQVSRICRDFASNLPADINLSKNYFFSKSEKEISKLHLDTKYNHLNIKPF